MKTIRQMIQDRFFPEIEILRRKLTISADLLKEYNRRNIELERRLQSKTDQLKTIKINKKYSTNQMQNWSKKIRSIEKCHCCEFPFIRQDLQAHHLWSKTLHPSLAIKRTNGVALCPECHDGYHLKYRIEDCSPYTYNAFKTDENNKTKVKILEQEVKELKEAKEAKGHKLHKISSYINKTKEALSKLVV